MGISRSDAVEKHRAVLSELGVSAQLSSASTRKVVASGPTNGQEDPASEDDGGEKTWTDTENEAEHVSLPANPFRPSMRGKSTPAFPLDAENDLDLFLLIMASGTSAISPDWRLVEGATGEPEKRMYHRFWHRLRKRGYQLKGGRLLSLSGLRERASGQPVNLRKDAKISASSASASVGHNGTESATRSSSSLIHQQTASHCGISTAQASAQQRPPESVDAVAASGTSLDMKEETWSEEERQVAPKLTNAALKLRLEEDPDMWDF